MFWDICTFFNHVAFLISFLTGLHRLAPRHVIWEVIHLKTKVCLWKHRVRAAFESDKLSPLFLPSRLARHTLHDQGKPHNVVCHEINTIYQHIKNTNIMFLVLNFLEYTLGQAVVQSAILCPSVGYILCLSLGYMGTQKSILVL